MNFAITLLIFTVFKTHAEDRDSINQFVINQFPNSYTRNSSLDRYKICGEIQSLISKLTSALTDTAAADTIAIDDNTNMDL